MTRPTGAPGETAAAIDAANAVLRTRAGLVLGAQRCADLKASLSRIMANAGAADPTQWAALLKADDGLFDQVVADVIIGETYFFREPEHFAFVRRDVLPRHGSGRPVRVWSAGCATGEEPYSLAILFDEAGAPAQILATDISRPSLAKAKQGIYGRWSLRGEGARLIGSYLHPLSAERNGSFALIERLRPAVHFAYLNLAEDSNGSLDPPESMDLIFCRNVLIYLDAPVIARIARRFFAALADGGVLVMGPSDPLLGDSAPFVTETTPGGLIYRKDVHCRRNLPLPTMAAEPHVPEAPPPLEPLAAETLPVQDLHADIAQAFAGGDNARVVALAASLPGDERAAVLGVRAGANLGDMARAATLADAAAKAHPASAEIAFLHAIVLMNLGRLGEAETVLRRLVYLDHNLAVAHFALGNLRLRMGDPATARRAFTAVHKIAAARPPGEILALSEGETAGSLAAAASALAARLAGGAPASSVRRASR